MAGIIFESIAACRRATCSLRFLRVSKRAFVLYPSLVQHRCRRHSSSDGHADGSDKDQLLQKKPIQLGQGLGPMERPGLEVTAAPPDPKDVPGEKRTELPYEVRPELPMETQPIRIQPSPLEVKPPSPHTIICTSDSGTLPTLANEVTGDKAAKAESPTIESEAELFNSSSNELPPSPVINLMDDETPSPTTTELDSVDSPFISIEFDQNYPHVTEFVRDAKHQDSSSVKSEPTSQDSSLNDRKTEATQSPIESKDELKDKTQTTLPIQPDLKSQDLYSTKSEPNAPSSEYRLDIEPQNLPITSRDPQTHLTSEDDSRPVSKEPESGTTLDLKVKPQERKADFHSSPSADNSERSSRPESETVGSGWSQGSSFDLPGEGKIAEREAKVEPIIYSSAKDGYDSQYGQILDKDEEKKRTLAADTVSKNVGDELIDQWVDKFKRLYMAENAAFGLNNENQVGASSENQYSDPNSERERNRLLNMVMKDNRWVYDKKDTAETSELISSTTDKSGHVGTLPPDINAKPEASCSKKDENPVWAMVMKNNEWVIEKKETAGSKSPSSELNSSTSDNSSHGGTLPPNKIGKPEASNNKNDENPVWTMVMKNNEWVIEKKDTTDTKSPSSELNSFTTDKSSHGDTLPLNIKAKHETSSNIKDESPERTESVFEKDTRSEPVLRTTDRSSHEGDFTLDPEVITEAPSVEQNRKIPFLDPKDEKDEKPSMSMTKKNSMSVPRNKDSKENADNAVKSSPDILAIDQVMSPSQTTEEIVAMFKDDSSDDLIKTEDSKDQELLETLHPISSKADDLRSVETENAAPNKDSVVKPSPDISAIEVKSLIKTTEGIVDVFMDEHHDIIKTEDSKDQKILETLADKNKSSRSDVQGSIEKEAADPNKESKIDKARADKEADDYFSKLLLGLDESIVAHEDAEVEPINRFDSKIKGDGTETSNTEEDKFISSSVGMEMEISQNDEALKPTNFDLAEKVSSFIRAAKESDSREMDQRRMSSSDEGEQEVESQTETTSMLPGNLYDPVSNEVSGDMPTETAEVEVNFHKEEDQLISTSVGMEMEISQKDEALEATNFDLAEKVSSFIRATKNLDSSEMDQRRISFTDEVKQEVESQSEIISMLPGDLYDPVSNEVSSPMPMETAGVEESEDLNPGLEAPEVKAKKEKTTVPEPHASDKSTAKDSATIPNAKNPASKEKPELDHGELSMKLLDTDTGSDMPSAPTETSEAKTQPPPLKVPPSPARKIPPSRTDSRPPGEKSFIQKLFDKILGGTGKNDGTRQMSTYTVRRQLSSSTFGILRSLSPAAKDIRQESPVRAFVLGGFVSDIPENRELKPDHEAPTKGIVQEANIKTPVVELFAKKTKDLTEIMGGTSSCSSPKKSPRELLQDKQNSKKIKILGGSEEYAKKMKRLKELTKNTDDDCDRDQFSISQFLSRVL